MIHSFMTHLSCLTCGRIEPADLSSRLCLRCGDGGADAGVLDVVYDYDAARSSWPDRSGYNSYKGIGRYTALLPVPLSNASALPVGRTPLVRADRIAELFGTRALYLKDETRNPTRSLKDRATAVAVAIARTQGYNTMYCASAGNAAISLAGFCAMSGLSCEVYVPRTTSATRLAWLKRFGARVHISSGDYDMAFTEAEAAGRSQGWYSRNCALNPFLVEGKKTAAYEIAEELNWTVPDIVIVPVGDGCTLGAIGKGFRELVTFGLTERVPQLIGVQSRLLSPVVTRFWCESGGTPPTDTPADNGEQRTQAIRAASIAVRHPRNAKRVLLEIARSGGTMVAVDDDAVATAVECLAKRAGLIAEFASATTLAALSTLATRESLTGKTVVLVITGGRPDGDS